MNELESMLNNLIDQYIKTNNKMPSKIVTHKLFLDQFAKEQTGIIILNHHVYSYDGIDFEINNDFYGFKLV